MPTTTVSSRRVSPWERCILSSRWFEAAARAVRRGQCGAGGASRQWRRRQRQVQARSNQGSVSQLPLRICRVQRQNLKSTTPAPAPHACSPPGDSWSPGDGAVVHLGRRELRQLRALHGGALLQGEQGPPPGGLSAASGACKRLLQLSAHRAHTRILQEVDRKKKDEMINLAQKVGGGADRCARVLTARACAARPFPSSSGPPPLILYACRLACLPDSLPPPSLPACCVTVLPSLPACLQAVPQHLQPSPVTEDQRNRSVSACQRCFSQRGPLPRSWQGVLPVHSTALCFCLRLLPPPAPLCEPHAAVACLPACRCAGPTRRAAATRL